MNAQSGISPSKELIQAFADAQNDSTRALIVTIEKEVLVVSRSLPIESTFQDDLEKLQTILRDEEPAYVLFRLDDSTGWLFISYVPDVAKVRSKMIYASTQSSVTRPLGEAKFVDSLYANSKADLTPAGYEAHVRHSKSSAPMTDKEKELADMKRVEGVSAWGTDNRKAAWDVGGGGSGATLGLKWVDGTEEALKKVWEFGGALYLTIDTKTESIGVKVYTLGNMVAFNLPEKEPSYTFVRFDGGAEKQLVFIYSCPSSSPIKSRLLYSSSSSNVVLSANNILNLKVAKKIETSDPEEITPNFLASELNVSSNAAPPATTDSKTTPFAKPKRPGRK